MNDSEKALCRVIKASIAGAVPTVTITDLAPAVGLTYSQLSNIANGRTAPKPETVAKLRAELRLPASWPESEVRKYTAYGSLVDIEEEPELEVRLVGNVAAGAQIYNVDPERRVISLPLRLARHTDVAFIVDGDSMMPHIQDSDCACFKHRAKLRHGFPFLIETEDGGLMVKVAWFDRGEWYLRSYNTAHRPFKVPSGARCLGIFIGWYRKQGKRESMDMDPDGLDYGFEERFSASAA